MADTERDWRLNPRPGDVLYVIGQPKRKVARFGVNQMAVRYREVGMMQRRGHPIEIAYMRAWRLWAANAVLVKRGDSE